MTPRKTRGPISKTVKELCVRLCLMNGSETEFKQGIKQLVEANPHYQAIGTSLQKWALEYCKDDVERLWELVDQVDIRIRKAWEKYRDGF